MCAPASYTQPLSSCSSVMVMGLLASPFPNKRLTHRLCGGISHAYELADIDPRSHLSTLHPSLDVMFRKASVVDACLKSDFALPFDLSLLNISGSF